MGIYIIISNLTNGWGMIWKSYEVDKINEVAKFIFAKIFNVEACKNLKVNISVVVWAAEMVLAMLEIEAWSKSNYIKGEFHLNNACSLDNRNLSCRDRGQPGEGVNWFGFLFERICQELVSHSGYPLCIILNLTLKFSF